MDNSTTSGSVEELKEESNLIIYIAGLILLIIWKVAVMCQVRLEAQAIGETGGEPATGAVKQSTTPFFSQSDTHSRSVWLMYLAKVLGTDL